MYYMKGASEGSTENGTREAGDQTCDRWYARPSAFPLHHGGFLDGDRIDRIDSTFVVLMEPRLAPVLKTIVHQCVVSYILVASLTLIALF